jgi:site-specific recombinase XerD
LPTKQFYTKLLVYNTVVLEQIQFLLGHVSIQTTERYLGGKQRIRSAVNDRIGIEPAT